MTFYVHACTRPDGERRRGLQRDLARGDTTMLTKHFLDIEITVQVLGVLYTEWQPTTGNGSVESQCRPQLAR